MSTNTLIDAVLAKVPHADPAAVLDLIVSCDADLNKVFALLGVQSASKKRQMTFDNRTTKKPSKVFKTSADCVSLYTSEQVENANIYCSLISNVLDASMANRLAVQLHGDSHQWKYSKFYLFDREVSSGNPSAVYTDDETLLNGQSSFSYQGLEIDTKELFRFTPEMSTVRDTIEKIVHKYTPDWKAGFVVANKYTHRSEKLDWHSDQLTHLGPKPTIAALSVGCTREFKLKDRTVPPQRPVYSIHIPHNSLLIMHGECQERFKHCVPPASSVDPDPLLGSARISLTFRMYRPELNFKTIPRCRCDVGMVLRNTLPNKNGEYKYIWQCAKGYIDGKGCDETKLYTKQ